MGAVDRKRIIAYNKARAERMDYFKKHFERCLTEKE
jgi:hypothetical protein